MYSYNHQRHEGVPHDLGIRSHQLRFGSLNPCLQQKGVKETTQKAELCPAASMAERQNGQTEPTMTDFAGLLLADPWHGNGCQSVKYFWMFSDVCCSLHFV